MRTCTYRRLITEAAIAADHMNFRLSECQRMLGIEPVKNLKRTEQIAEMIGTAVNYDTLFRCGTIRRLHEKRLSYVNGPPQFRARAWEDLLREKWRELGGTSIRHCLLKSDPLTQRKAVDLIKFS